MLAFATVVPLRVRCQAGTTPRRTGPRMSEQAHESVASGYPAHVGIRLATRTDPGSASLSV